MSQKTLGNKNRQLVCALLAWLYMCVCQYQISSACRTVHMPHELPKHTYMKLLVRIYISYFVKIVCQFFLDGSRTKLEMIPSLWWLYT